MGSTPPPVTDFRPSLWHRKSTIAKFRRPDLPLPAERMTRQGYTRDKDCPGGSGKAEGSAQVLPMAEGPAIGKLTFAAATLDSPFLGGMGYYFLAGSTAVKSQPAAKNSMW